MLCRLHHISQSMKKGHSNCRSEIRHYSYISTSSRPPGKIVERRGCKLEFFKPGEIYGDRMLIMMETNGKIYNDYDKNDRHLIQSQTWPPAMSLKIDLLAESKNKYYLLYKFQTRSTRGISDRPISPFPPSTFPNACFQL